MYLFGGTVQPGSFQQSPEAAGTEQSTGDSPNPSSTSEPCGATALAQSLGGSLGMSQSRLDVGLGTLLVDPAGARGER